MDTQDLVAIEAVAVVDAASPIDTGFYESATPSDAGVAELLAEAVNNPAAAQHIIVQRSFGRTDATHPMLITAISGA